MALSTQAEARSRQQAISTSRRRRRGWSRYSPRTFYLFISPWIIGCTAFTLFPMVYALVVSFTDFDGMSAHWHWIGLANYQELLVTPDT